MKNNRPTVKTKVESKLKIGTKINIIIGMISVLFIGVMLFNAAFLTTPVTVSQTKGENLREKDVIAPYIEVTSPENLQVFKIGQKIKITAYAYDENEVAYVDFFLNNVLKMRDDDSSNGWGLPWDTTSYQAGKYVIYARAVDEAENLSDLSERIFVILK